MRLGAPRPALGIGLALSVVFLAAGLRAQEAPLEARFELAPELAVGDHATLWLVVTTAETARQPLLVTPSSDGPALEVVHGRLFREDAEDPAAPALRFRVPVHATSPGDAVIRARVDGYACEAERCQPVSAEASLRLRVRPAAALP